jgi:hypothetical protein
MSQYEVGARLGYQQISAPGTSTALTVPKGARMALISVSTQAIRFRDDGPAPTATVGFPLAAAGNPFLYSGNVNAIRIIQQTAGAVVDVVYYGG